MSLFRLRVSRTPDRCRIRVKNVQPKKKNVLQFSIYSYCDVNEISHLIFHPELCTKSARECIQAANTSARHVAYIRCRELYIFTIIRNREQRSARYKVFPRHCTSDECLHPWKYRFQVLFTRYLQLPIYVLIYLPRAIFFLCIIVARRIAFFTWKIDNNVSVIIFVSLWLWKSEKC